MAQAQRTMRPALPPPRMMADVYEMPGGDAFVVEIPLPGLEPGEIVAEATSDTVTVSTQPRETEAESSQRYIQREQLVWPMSRVFQFPVDIDTDNVRAKLERGILKLHVPKAASGRRKVIRIAPSS